MKNYWQLILFITIVILLFSGIALGYGKVTTKMFELFETVPKEVIQFDKEIIIYGICPNCSGLIIMRLEKK